MTLKLTPTLSMAMAMMMTLLQGPARHFDSAKL